MAEDELLREDFPSSEDGGSEDDYHGATKKPKTESKYELSWENANEAGIYGRKPLKLADTASHALVLGQSFPSR
jgi:hypothetical protein